MTGSRFGTAAPFSRSLRGRAFFCFFLLAVQLVPVAGDEGDGFYLVLLFLIGKSSFPVLQTGENVSKPPFSFLESVQKRKRGFASPKRKKTAKEGEIDATSPLGDDRSHSPPLLKLPL